MRGHRHDHNKAYVLVEPLEPRSYMTVTAPAGSTASDQSPSGVYAAHAVAADLAPPADLQAPATVTAAPTFGETPGRVLIQWSGAYSGQTGFDVQRSDDGGLTWNTVTTANASATSYIDTTFPPNTTCSYRVCALALGASGDYTTSAPFVTPPAAPASLTATVTAITVKLTWPTSAGATEYWIGKSTDGVNWTVLVRTASTAYTDSAVTVGNTYYYAVRGYNGASALVSVMQLSAPSPVTLPPVAPYYAPTLTWANGIVNVSWLASAGATSYTVQRSPDQSAWTTVATTAATSFGDATNAPGVTVYYRVIASNAGGASSPTSALSIAVPPDAPAYITAGVVGGTVQIAWPAAAGATSYMISRSTDNIYWTVIGTTLTTYTDTAVTAGGTYHYDVRSVSGTGVQSRTPLLASATFAPVAPNYANLNWANGSMTVSWHAVSGATRYTVQRSPDGTTWITLGSTAGTSFNDATLAVTPGLPISYRVYASNAGGDSAPTAASTFTFPPAAPGVPLFYQDWRGIHVRMPNVVGAIAYRVERSTDNATWTVLSDWYSMSEFLDAPASPGTYYYRLTARNSFAGPDSAPSPACAVTVGLPPPVGPITVTSMGSAYVRLTWANVDPSADDQYRAERSADGGVTWTVLEMSDLTTLDDTPPVVPGATYVYRLTATNWLGDAAPTTATWTLAPYHLVAPISLTAVLQGTETPDQIKIQWINASWGQTGFDVQRTTDGGQTWTTITTADASATSYFDTTYPPNATCSYRVCAVAAGGASGPYATAPGSIVAPPAAPASVTTTLIRGAILVAWPAVTPASSYWIARSTDGGVTWTMLGWVTTPGLTDPDITAGGSYSYKVRSYNGATGRESVAQFTAAPVTLAPPAASGVTATPAVNGAGNMTVALTWVAANGATGYQVLRSLDGSSWTPLGFASGASFTDPSPSLSTADHYAVIALNAGGASAASDPTSITLAPPPASAVTATPVTDGVGNVTVALQWTASNGATAYQILRSLDGGATWTPLGSTGDTTFTDSVPAFGGTSTYAVVASVANAGAAPATATVTLVPPAPTALRAVATSKSTIALTWSAPPADARATFTVQTSTDGVTWTTLAVTRRGVTSFTATGLARATGYWYRVCTNGPSINSDFSAPATARTSRYDPPGTPGAFAAVPTSTSSIQLSWSAPTGDVTGFVLERSSDGRHWSPLVTLTSAARTYVNTKLTKGVRYYYRIHSFGPAGNSLAPVASAVPAVMARTRIRA